LQGKIDRRWAGAFGNGNATPSRRPSRSTRRPSPVVMPGLVPLLSGLEFRRVLCAHGRHRLCPLVSPRPCAGVQRSRARTVPLPWTPAQGRGDTRETTGGAGVPKSVSRVERSAGNPLVPMRSIQPAKSKPDTSGLVPGIHAPPPLRPRPARTAMPQDVDTRNKSGHDGRNVVGLPPVNLSLLGLKKT